MGADGENVDDAGRAAYPGMSAPDRGAQWVYDNAAKGKEADARNFYLKRFNEATLLFKTQIRAFDCSGLVCWGIREAGIRTSYDRTADSLKKACIPINNSANLRRGDLLFDYSSTEGKITHVGIYVGDNKVVEAAGTNYGVVSGVGVTRRYSSSGNGRMWSHFGRLFATSQDEIDKNAIKEEQPTDTQTPEYATINTVIDKLVSRASQVFDNQKAMVARQCYASKQTMSIDLMVAIMNFKMMNDGIDGCTSAVYTDTINQMNALKTKGGNYFDVIFYDDNISIILKPVATLDSEYVLNLQRGLQYLQSEASTVLNTLKQYSKITTAFLTKLYAQSTTTPDFVTDFEQRMLDTIWGITEEAVDVSKLTVESRCVLTYKTDYQDISAAKDFYTETSRKLPVSYIQNIATGYWTPLPVFQNNLSESISASFTPTAIPGRTSQFYTYTGTSNRTWNLNLQMHIDILEDMNDIFAGDNPQENMLKIVSFIKSLQYPQYTQGRINPPICIFKLGDVLGHTGKRGIFQGISVNQELPISKIIKSGNKQAEVNSVYNITGTFIEIPDTLLDEEDIRLDYQNMFG